MPEIYQTVSLGSSVNSGNPALALGSAQGHCEEPLIEENYSISVVQEPAAVTLGRWILSLGTLTTFEGLALLISFATMEAMAFPFFSRRLTLQRRLLRRIPQSRDFYSRVLLGITNLQVLFVGQEAKERLAPVRTDNRLDLELFTQSTFQLSSTVRVA